MGAAVQRKMIDYVFDIFHHQLNSVKSVDLTEFEPINKVDRFNSMHHQNKMPNTRFGILFWWGWLESNRLPKRYEHSALTDELHPLVEMD